MTRPLLFLLLCVSGQAQAYDALIGASESDAQAFHGPLLPGDLPETATEEPTQALPEAIDALEATGATETPVAAEVIEVIEATETQTVGTPISWDEPESEATTEAPAVETNPLSLLLMPFGIAALGGALLLRNKLIGKTKPGDTNSMTVVARKAMGNHSALVVIDVTDLEGQTRRLLIGTGQGSSPSLVADIGGAFGGLQEMEMASTQVDTGFEYSSLRQTAATRRSYPVLDSSKKGEQQYDEFVPQQREAAQTLVDEMLSEREDYGEALHEAQVRVTA